MSLKGEVQRLGTLKPGLKHQQGLGISLEVSDVSLPFCCSGCKHRLGLQETWQA